MKDSYMTERIEYRLQCLEYCLCSNVHIHTPSAVTSLMARLRPHYKSMNRKDKAYMRSAEVIINEKIPYDGS